MNLATAHTVYKHFLAIMASLCIYGCGAQGSPIGLNDGGGTPVLVPIEFEDPQFFVRAYSDFMHAPNMTLWGTGEFNSIVQFEVRIPKQPQFGPAIIPRIYRVYISYRGSLSGDSAVSSSYVVYPPELADTLGMVFTRFAVGLDRTDTTFVGSASLSPVNTNMEVDQPGALKLYPVGRQPMGDSL